MTAVFAYPIVFLLAIDFHELTRFSALESGICLAIELRQISRTFFAADANDLGHDLAMHGVALEF